MPPLGILDTHKQVWVNLFWGCSSCLLVPGVHTFKKCSLLNSLCPPRVSASPVLWKFCREILLVLKVKFPGGSQSLCWIPMLRNLLWALEFLQQCENFFAVIVLQFVGHLLGGSVVGLTAASSKKTYTTGWASQDCCSRTPCPRGRPLLTCAYARDTQTLKGRFGSVSRGGLLLSWVLVGTKLCLYPPSISGSYEIWLSMWLHPSYHLEVPSPLPLNVGYLFFGGIQHSPVNGV